MVLNPTMHKPIPLQTRVILPDYHNNMTGTVCGIATMGIFFTYIVLLDKPINNEYGENSAVVANGLELKSEVTGLKWLIDSYN